jgi:photosystem II stability/assembly factor-like uncharacterized protein
MTRKILKITLLKSALLNLLFLSFSFSTVAQWTSLNGPYGAVVTAVVADNNHVYAGTNTGHLFVSSDKGATWKSTNANLSVTYGSPIKVLHLFNGMITIASDNSCFRSLDFGETWLGSTTGLKSTTTNAISLKDTTLFLATLNGVFYSTDKGKNWIEGTAGFPKDGYGSPAGATAMVADDNAIYAGTYEFGIFI